MKTKKEVAELIRLRIAELEEAILEMRAIGDDKLVEMYKSQLAVRQRELEIFK